MQRSLSSRKQGTLLLIRSPICNHTTDQCKDLTDLTKNKRNKKHDYTKKHSKSYNRLEMNAIVQKGIKKDSGKPRHQRQIKSFSSSKIILYLLMTPEALEVFQTPNEKQAQPRFSLLMSHLIRTSN